MSKAVTPRKLDVNEASAKLKRVRISPQKLSLVAQLIRGMKADQALVQLKFCRKRIAKDVEMLLQSAIANAENNHDLDIEELIVSEAFVGKNLVLKRGRPRARGRYGKILKPFSQLTIKVRQVLQNNDKEEKV